MSITADLEDIKTILKWMHDRFKDPLSCEGDPLTTQRIILDYLEQLNELVGLAFYDTITGRPTLTAEPPTELELPEPTPLGQEVPK